MIHRRAALAACRAVACALACLLWLPAAAKVDGNTIVLGAALSETGRYAANGMHARNGYDLAAARINERGGIEVAGQSYRLSIVYYDDESSPERVAQLGERLIVSDGIKFMLGPYSSGLVGAMAEVTEAHGIPMVQANGAARSLFTRGHRSMFAVLSSAEQYLASAVDLLAERSADLGKSPSEVRLAIGFENDSFSQDVRLGVLETAESHGMRIAVDATLPEGLADMTEFFGEVRAVGPDAILISGHATGAATAARQIAQLQVDAPAIALTHCDAAQIEIDAPAGAEHLLCALQWQKQLSYRDDDGLFGSGEDFARAFSAAYGYEPPYQAAESAAAVQVWADAIRRAQSFDLADLRASLAATDMQTFFGNIRFNAAGQNIAKPMVLSQIIDGSYRVVAPEQWAETRAVIPRPAPGQ